MDLRIVDCGRMISKMGRELRSGLMDPNSSGSTTKVRNMAVASICGLMGRSTMERGI